MVVDDLMVVRLLGCKSVRLRNDQGLCGRLEISSGSFSFSGNASILA